MGLQLTCPRGHHWEAPAAGPTDTQRICPRCGAPPLAQLVSAVSSAGAGRSMATLAEAAPAIAVPKPIIAGYEILGELGRGGMGVVYQARHTALKRVVALKMVLSGVHAGSVELARFRAESEAVARLQHPNIVQIYEVGENDGRPYCALEYVSGGSLAQRLGGKPLAPPTAAKIVAALAEGVQHAHDHDIVHRDLKPANVLLGAGGMPKITDFGLAKHLDSPDGQTKTGTVLGTPSYMAPEQAMGKNRTIGPVTDIYALGAILYECLTGRPPFKAETSLDTLLQVASQEPVPPTQLNPQVPRDLETICLKCLRKEPGKRYPNARELAEDLGRFIRNEPIRARPVGAMERAIKWAKRRPAWTAAVFMAMLLPLLAGVIVWQWRHRGQAGTTYVENERFINTDELVLYSKRIVQAEQECNEGRFHQAELILAECPEKLRGWEWDYLKRLCNWGVNRTLTGFGPIQQVAVGRFGRVAVASDAPGIQVHDGQSGKLLVKLGESHGPVHAIAFSPDGKQLAAAGSDRFLRIYDFANGKELTARDHGDLLRCIAYSPDGKWLAVGGGSGQNSLAWIWNATPGNQPARKLIGHKHRVASLAFSFDSRLLTTFSLGDLMRAWDVSSGTPVGDYPYKMSHTRLIFDPRGPHNAMLSLLKSRVDVFNYQTQKEEPFGLADTPKRMTGGIKIGMFEGEIAHDDQPNPRSGGTLTDAAFSTDGKWFALAGGWPTQGKVRVYRGNAFNASVLFLGHTEPVTTVSFAPDGAFLATGSRDGTVRIWDPAMRRFDASLGSAQAPALALSPAPGQSGMAFSPDSQYLVTLDRDALTLALWDLHTGRKTACPRLTDKGSLLAPYFSSDGRTVAAITGNGIRTVCMWSLAGTKVATFSDHPVSGGALGLSRDGFLLASAFPDQPIKGFLDRPTPGIRLIAPSTGQTLRTVGEQSFWLPFPILSPDGRRLAAISKEGALTLWETETGKALLPGSPGRGTIRFTRDGRYLLRFMKGLEVWDARTGKPVGFKLPTGENLTQSVRFSPVGQVIAILSKNNAILLWNGATGKAVATLRGHGSPVASMAFSADGRRLFTVSAEDAAVKVWDTTTGVEICTLHHAKGNQGELLLSPDGRRLALRNTGGTFVWDASPLPPEVIPPAK